MSDAMKEAPGESQPSPLPWKAKEGSGGASKAWGIVAANGSIVVMFDFVSQRNATDIVRACNTRGALTTALEDLGRDIGNVRIRLEQQHLKSDAQKAEILMLRHWEAKITAALTRADGEP